MRGAAYVAYYPAQLRSQTLQGPVGTVELFGVCIALMADQRYLADARIRLAQLKAEPLGQPHQMRAGGCGTAMWHRSGR
ncbi:hypothetical protein SAMN02746095_03932 [Acidocella aminolytica 101 = DSM 11237]|nr:hypothetical protein SAMN02746095_03932 [Acidocella aminolytica 101 = DSM 11237]